MIERKLVILSVRSNNLGLSGAGISPPVMELTQKERDGMMGGP